MKIMSSISFLPWFFSGSMVSAPAMFRPLEFDKNRQVDAIFNFLEVWSPQSAIQGTIARRRGRAVHARKQRWVAVVAAGRCNAAGPGPIRHVGRTMIELPPEGNILARHPVKRAGGIPSLERVSRVPREVRRIDRCRLRRCSVDRWNQHEVAPRIVDSATAERQAVLVIVEPEAVIEHEPEEALLRALPRPSVAAHAATVLASGVARQRESHLAEEILRVVVVLDLDAVVGVIPHAARNTKGLFAEGILISEHGEPSIRPVQDLRSESWPVIESTVGLPPVSEPRLDLKVLCRKNLHAYAIEKPRRVGRNKRRLVRPVVKIVVTEQPDVRHEDSRVDVNAVQHIKVIAAVGLGNVAVRGIQTPLSARRA